MRANPYFLWWPKFPPNLHKSALCFTPLPTELLNNTTGSSVSSVLRATFEHQVLGARFLVLHKTNPPQLSPTEFAAKKFGDKMLNWVQVVTTPTADTNGTCLLLHFDNKRYLLGHVSEGTQRAFIQRGIGIQRVEDVFLSGPVGWRNAGGLLGLILVLADTLAGRIGSLKANALKDNAEERKKKGKRSTQDNKALPRLGIHGGKNTAQLLATARRFIFRKGLPLAPHEVRHDPRAEEHTYEPDWEDANIKVWYMPVQSTMATPTSPRKRTHDEFAEANQVNEQARFQDPGRDKTLVDTIVTQMFDSNWTMDALIETTLHQVKLPAKVFIRENNKIQVYTGPLPGRGKEVPDIPVLVRQPWPGAMIETLPSTRPSNKSMCYIVKSHDRRGKFKPEVARELGVAISDYSILTSGQNVQGKDGAVVTPAMVLGETVIGSGFALVDLPDASYIDGLVHRKEWTDDNIMKGLHVIFWILGDGLKDDPRVQEFMQKMSSVRHIVTSTDSCPNMISLESPAAQAFKLRCIDPDRFPLPDFDNHVSLSNTPVPNTSIYETGRTGKTIQFAPSYLHQDDQIVPFPDIEKLVRDGLDDQVLEMARQAKAKVSDPEFLAKVEKVESDIPNRDTEIITLGTGSSSPSKYRNVSATLVRVPGYGNYLFDCGENTIGQLRRSFGRDLPEILRDLKCIWISHLHADHHLGTASVIKAWHEETRKSRPSAKLLVTSHTHMIDWLREYADIEDYGFDRLLTYNFQSLHPDFPGRRICRSPRPDGFTEEETEAIGLKQIDACFVKHCFGALAAVFTFPSGLKIAYSGDCRPDLEDFIKIGQGATVLIHESTFDDDLQGDAIAKKHSTMSEAIEVSRRMGARRTLLTHFSQRYQKIPLMEQSLEVQPEAEDGDKAQKDEVILVAFDHMRVKLGDFRKAQAFLPTLQRLFQDVQDDQ